MRGGRVVPAQVAEVLARATGHDTLARFEASDLTTFHREMAHLSGIRYGGISQP